MPTILASRSSSVTVRKKLGRNPLRFQSVSQMKSGRILAKFWIPADTEIEVSDFFRYFTADTTDFFVNHFPFVLLSFVSSSSWILFSLVYIFAWECVCFHMGVRTCVWVRKFRSAIHILLLSSNSIISTLTLFLSKFTYFNLQTTIVFCFFV